MVVACRPDAGTVDENSFLNPESSHAHTRARAHTHTHSHRKGEESSGLYIPVAYLLQ